MSQDTDTHTRRGFLLPALLGLGVLGIVTAAIAIGLSHKTALPGGASATKAAAFDGAALTPVKPAPPIDLRNYLGHPIDLASDRGKAVFVTFLYTHCPDVCPAIAAKLRVAQSDLGSRAANVRIVAVSVDPAHDDRASVAAFLRAHEMTGKMQYLIGSPAELGRVWQAWNVGSQRDAGNPEFVAHSALVYGISASGKVTTIYSANFDPAQVVHDAPLLASR